MVAEQVIEQIKPRIEPRAGLPVVGVDQFRPDHPPRDVVNLEILKVALDMVKVARLEAGLRFDAVDVIGQARAAANPAYGLRDLGSFAVVATGSRPAGLQSGQSRKTCHVEEIRRRVLGKLALKQGTYGRESLLVIHRAPGRHQGDEVRALDEFVAQAEVGESQRALADIGSKIAQQLRRHSIH
ncbi:MAG: hypothetical protein ACXWDH_01580 [Aeromicrobium sp.]